MDVAIIATYRCNARCRMCNTWAHPTRRSEEFAPDLLRTSFRMAWGVQRSGVV